MIGRDESDPAGVLGGPEPAPGTGGLEAFGRDFEEIVFTEGNLVVGRSAIVELGLGDEVLPDPVRPRRRRTGV